MPFTFRPHEHLRRPQDFQRVYDRRKSAADEWVLVYVCENGLPFARLGRSVARKFGGAVRRNRLRRLLREAFRLTRDQMPVGIDIVVVPRKVREVPPLDALLRSLPRQVRHAAIKLGKPPGGPP